MVYRYVKTVSTLVENQVVSSIDLVGLEGKQINIKKFLTLLAPDWGTEVHFLVVAALD